MISYNTFTNVTALLGVLFYLFVRKDRVDYGQQDITINSPCSRVFESMTDVKFIEKTNNLWVRTKVLSHEEDSTKLTKNILVYEDIPYIGEISFENQLTAYRHNKTILHRADVWGGYLISFVQWQLIDPDEDSRVCRLEHEHWILVPYAFKSFVRSQSEKAHQAVITNTKSLLE